MSISSRWSAEKIELVDVPESYGKIFKLSNVKYTYNKNLEYKKVEGKTFFGKARYHLWHYLYDELSQYCYLKKHIPDLNYFITSPPPFLDCSKLDFFEQLKHISFYTFYPVKPEVESHKFFEDLFKIFVKQDYIYNFENESSGNFIFDEIYFVEDQTDSFQKIIETLINTKQLSFSS